MSEHKTASLRSFDDKTPGASSSFPRTRRIVLAHGWNSTSYQILNPGIRHWLASADDAVVGFVSCFGVRVAAGAPICARERLLEVAFEFERAAARAASASAISAPKRVSKPFTKLPCSTPKFFSERNPSGSPAIGAEWSPGTNL